MLKRPDLLQDPEHLRLVDYVRLEGSRDPLAYRMLADWWEERGDMDRAWCWRWMLARDRAPGYIGSWAGEPAWCWLCAEYHFANTPDREFFLRHPRAVIKKSVFVRLKWDYPHGNRHIIYRTVAEAVDNLALTLQSLKEDYTLEDSS